MSGQNATMSRKQAQKKQIRQTSPTIVSSASTLAAEETLTIRLVDFQRDQQTIVVDALLADPKDELLSMAKSIVNS